MIRNSMSGTRGFDGAVYLDLEMWPLTGASPQSIAENVAKYIRVAQIAHDVAPTASIGYYGLILCREYWGLVTHDQKQMRDWQECNRQGAVIAQYVQLLFPSLYTFYNDQQFSTRRALTKKPVYVFLWPEFHPSNAALKGGNIPGKFWRHQLDFCRSKVDGIVIWGGGKNNGERTLTGGSGRRNSCQR